MPKLVLKNSRKTGRAPRRPIREFLGRMAAWDSALCAWIIVKEEFDY
jgi:hypothetical protein